MTNILNFILSMILFILLLLLLAFYSSSEKPKEIKTNQQTKEQIHLKNKEAIIQLYQEYINARDDNEKQTICSIISLQFSDFDETKLEDNIKAFMMNCKYN